MQEHEGAGRRRQEASLTTNHGSPTGSVADSDRQTADGSQIVARLERLPLSRFHLPFYVFLGTGTFFDSYNSLAIASALSVVFVVLHISLTQAGSLLGIAYLGQLAGALVFGAASERFGRKPVFITSLVVFGIFSIVTAFAWSYTSLYWFRLAEGFGLGGEVPVAVALFNEVVKGSRRGALVAMYESLFAWGIFLTPLIAYALLRIFGAALSWRILFGLGAIPVIVAIPAMFFLPESPRWLVNHGRADKAELIVAKGENRLLAKNASLPDPQRIPLVRGSRSRFLELFEPAYLGRTAMLWIIWFVAYFVEYGFTVWLPGLYVRVGHLPASRSLLLTAVSGAFSVAASYALVYTLDRFGRRPTFQAAFGIMIVGGLFGWVGIGILHYSGWQWLFTAAVIMLIGGSILALGMYIYTPELYPTRMRGWGTSFCSTGNRLASYLGPIIVGDMLGAGLGLGWVFFIMFLASVIGLVVLSLFSPETRGKVLEELAP
jgi:MFS transporter, putative metabolite:H+ symporter